LTQTTLDYAHDGTFQVTIGGLNSFKLAWEPIQRRAYKVACGKAANEAARIATMFLCWDALKLVKDPKDPITSNF
jgi:hypothetical protein